MKIAVIGLGFMGTTHAAAWREIEGAELAAVVSRNERRLAGDFSDAGGNLSGASSHMDLTGVAKYLSAEAAIDDANVEAVDICLPTDQHEPVALAALAAGKHVLVEKPIALDGASADRMITAAQQAGRVLMAAQVVRFIPQYRHAAQIVKSGRLGAVRAAILRRRCAAPKWSEWLTDAARSGGGVFDLLIHDIDYCLFAFGKPESVSARGYADLARGIDWVTAQLSYPAIGAVTLSGGWHHPAAFPFSMEFTIVSDGGTLEFDSAAGGRLLEYGVDGVEHPVETPEGDGYRNELEYFLQCAKAGAEPVECRAEDSANAVRLARRILESRRRNGEEVACEL